MVFGEFLGWGTRGRVGSSGDWRKGVEAPQPFPTPCPVHLFHLAVSDLYPFIVRRSYTQ